MNSSYHHGLPGKIFKILLLSTFIVFLFVNNVLAEDKTAASKATKDSSGCTVVNGITTCALVNPLRSGTTDVNKIIGTAIKGVLGLVGALALFVFVQGGFAWLTSRGNPEQVQKGTKTMLWAFVGLMLVFMAYGFLTFLLGLLTKGK